MPPNKLFEHTKDATTSKTVQMLKNLHEIVWHFPTKRYRNWTIFNHFDTLDSHKAKWMSQSLSERERETSREMYWRGHRSFIAVQFATCVVVLLLGGSFVVRVDQICSKSIEIGFCGLSRSSQVIKKTLICRHPKQAPTTQTHTHTPSLFFIYTPPSISFSLRVSLSLSPPALLSFPQLFVSKHTHK